MSIEKKYTQEEIRAIVDEELRKLKTNCELSPDEMEKVSGGNQYYDANRQRILSTGEPYNIENAMKYEKVARQMHDTYGNWDVAEVFIEEVGFTISNGEFRNHGTANWLNRVRGTNGGY